MLVFCEVRRKIHLPYSDSAEALDALSLRATRSRKPGNYFSYFLSRNFLYSGGSCNLHGIRSMPKVKRRKTRSAAAAKASKTKKAKRKVKKKAKKKK